MGRIAALLGVVAGMVALAVWLLVRPGADPGTRSAPASLTRTAGLAHHPGRAVYARCQACHGVVGEGVPGMGPALRGSATVLGDAAAVRSRIIAGAPAVGDWRLPMPPFAGSDAELDHLVDYLRMVINPAGPR